MGNLLKVCEKGYNLLHRRKRLVLAGNNDGSSRMTKRTQKKLEYIDTNASKVLYVIVGVWRSSF